jgi:integrase/recombinase XerD
MRYSFHSQFAGEMESFIRQKENLGFIYRTGEFHLMNFDRYVSEHFPTEKILTREIAMGWATLRDGEHPNGLLRRITPIRQLAKYMNSIGLTAFLIPSGIPKKQIKYVPHIYTETELTEFFYAADNITPSIFSRTRHLVLPAYFRMLYCCGLRKTEARLLTVTDITLKKGTVLIRQSKGYKDRLVYMSDDLIAYLRNYDEKIGRLKPYREAFFPNDKGTFLGDCTPDVWFHMVWDNLSTAKRYAVNSPRVHDFRHTFAVKRLNLWVSEGKDVNAYIPYLSKYLGHTEFTSTDYYLHLVPEFFPVFCDKTALISNHLIPEVADE